ncbi:SDR family oxidoreductase [Bradyrhizobium frederickii]|uniref:SDR family oxidoreductase n=1 Tax=Bradyrhizobium frederickii TaxID=2560054 RepID=A0A4Y9KYJ5_9BRAD|nr:SDR family oxidoreductase [Bradyrhizobium frederickii]TFV35014.1 SDR family oxidoreductase [Bradyrhizobium frederickii]
MEQDRRIAIVTGGSRGIGRSTVLGLARRGVDSIFTFKAAFVEADAVATAVEEIGRRAIPLQLDLAEASSFDGFVLRFREALGVLGATRFDYLVNNAGISHHGRLESTTEAELDAIYRVNFKAVFFLTQKLLPLIKDGGRIVNMSSGLARIIVPGSGPYGAFKAAIEVLTRYQAKELGARGIAVNAVAPGAIRADFSDALVWEDPKITAQVASLRALGRPEGPEDIGAMIASLLSDENRWINAQLIEVSAG